MSAQTKVPGRCVEPACPNSPTHAVFVNDVKVVACRDHAEATPAKLIQQGRVGEWLHVAIVSLGPRQAPGGRQP